jgi:hypothetical protein
MQIKITTTYKSIQLGYDENFNNIGEIMLALGGAIALRPIGSGTLRV